MSFQSQKTYLLNELNVFILSGFLEASLSPATKTLHKFPLYIVLGFQADVKLRLQSPQAPS